LAFETGNAPYWLTYTSPEPPLFTNPLIGAETGTVYPQQFPVVVPPYNSSAKNPDSNINWPAYYPINGFDAYFPRNKNPYSENYFLSFERQFAGNVVFDASIWQSGTSPSGHACGQSREPRSVCELEPTG
jgi:hypothetical protein